MGDPAGEHALQAAHASKRLMYKFGTRDTQHLRPLTRSAGGAEDGLTVDRHCVNLAATVINAPTLGKGRI